MILRPGFVKGTYDDKGTSENETTERLKLCGLRTKKQLLSTSHSLY